MSLISRVLEQEGISTVIIGSARDIVELCGVARFLFTDFPLGNPIGKPFNREMQETNLKMGLSMLENVDASRTTWVSPFQWDESQDWRRHYMEIRDEDRDILLARGEQRRSQRKASQLQSTR